MGKGVNRGDGLLIASLIANSVELFTPRLHLKACTA
jgi:hypothetical protein